MNSLLFAGDGLIHARLFASSTALTFLLIYRISPVGILNNSLVRAHGLAGTALGAFLLFDLVFHGVYNCGEPRYSEQISQRDFNISFRRGGTVRKPTFHKWNVSAPPSFDGVFCTICAVLLSTWCRFSFFFRPPWPIANLPLACAW